MASHQERERTHAECAAKLAEERHARGQLEVKLAGTGQLEVKLAEETGQLEVKLAEERCARGQLEVAKRAEEQRMGVLVELLERDLRESREECVWWQARVMQREREVAQEWEQELRRAEMMHAEAEMQWKIAVTVLESGNEELRKEVSRVMLLLKAHVQGAIQELDRAQGGKETSMRRHSLIGDAIELRQRCVHLGSNSNPDSNTPSIYTDVAAVSIRAYVDGDGSARQCCPCDSPTPGHASAEAPLSAAAQVDAVAQMLELARVRDKERVLDLQGQLARALAVIDALQTERAQGPGGTHA